MCALKQSMGEGKSDLFACHPPDLLGTQGHLCTPDKSRVVGTYPVHSVPAGGQGHWERTASYHHISLSVDTCYTLW